MTGKFNLNQILTDVSKQAAPGGGLQTTATRAVDEIVKISVFDIVPSDDNFYSMNDIEELKSKIELAGKVLQNLVVVPLDGGKYKALAGHRRRLASIALVEEGKPQFEFVPCVVEANEDDAEVQAIREEIMLIATNSQRDKTAWDKIEEVRRMRALLEAVKKQTKLPGGMRDNVAKALNTSPAQIGRYDAIIKNLFPRFMEELKRDRINISTAYELSGLSWDEQREAFYRYQDSGTITIKDAKAAEQPPRPTPSPKVSAEPEHEEEPEEVAEEAADTTTATVESENRQQDPPAQEIAPPAPSYITAAFGEKDETAIAIMQLESLRDYCEAMHESDTDGGSRVWALDVDALNAAIAKLKQG